MIRVSRLLIILSMFVAFDSATSGTKKKAPKRPVKNAIVDHTKAYKKRPERGQHINIKVTPPEKRGKKRRVLVEVYNYSKTYVSVMDFWIYLDSTYGDQIEAHVTVDDLKTNWGDLTWIKIPGKGKIAPIKKVRIVNPQLFNAKGKRVEAKIFTDLIKK